MTSRGKILSALALLAPLALAGCSNPNGSPLVTTSAPPATGNPLPTAQTSPYGARTLSMPSATGGAGAQPSSRIAPYR